jgi:hypothetical protein
MKQFFSHTVVYPYVGTSGAIRVLTLAEVGLEGTPFYGLPERHT